MEEQKPHEGHSEHHTSHSHTSHGAGLGPEMDLPKFDTKNMDFQGGFKDVLQILKFDQGAIERVAKNEKLNLVALIFMIIGAIISPLSAYVFGIRILNVTVHPSFQDTLVGMIVQFVIAALIVFISALIATKVFNGKGTFVEFFRIIGLVYIINIITILGVLLPSLGLLFSLVAWVWLLIIEFITLKVIFKMDATNAILTMILTIVAFIVLGAALGAVGLGSMMNYNPRMGYGGSIPDMQVRF